jgi:hypothetical protein
METKEYIESGILELYVYGLLTSPKMKVALKKESLEINSEIVAIEIYRLVIIKFSPFYRQPTMRQYRETRTEVCKSNSFNLKLIESICRMGCRYSSIIGIGFQYNQLDQTTNQVVNATLEAKIEKI